jgi:hypothetical protein
MGAYAALSMGCFFILLLMIPELAGEPRSAPSLAARVIVIVGALVAMALIVHDLEDRPDRRTTELLEQSPRR